MAQVQGTNIRVRQTIEYGRHLINELTGKIVFMKVSVNLMEFNGIFIVLTIAYGSIWFWAYLAYLMAYGLIYNLVLKRDV